METATPSASPAVVFARPTADQIWLGPAQEAALSQLSNPARLQLLVGPPSCGKTTLLQGHAARLAKDCVVLHARGPKDSSAALLGSLLLSADLAPWELSAVEQRNLLTVFVQQRRAQRRRIVVAIDDAHRLENEAWEEIDRLLAFQIDRRPALEVLLAGPASLTHRAEQLGVERDKTLVHALPAPEPADVAGYIEWRLARHAMSDRLTPIAIQMIARVSGTRYAAVDVLCQMTLLLLRQLRLPRADARVVRQAMATLVARQSAKLERAEARTVAPAIAAPPQCHLLISKDGKVLNRVALGQRTLIGRSEHNDLCLPSPYLSRHHAVIVGTPDGYYVVDLNSVNGVLLNGNPVARAVLCDHDVLTLGPFRVKVQIPNWLAADPDPLRETEALADTAVMPAQLPQTPPGVRLIK